MGIMPDVRPANIDETQWDDEDPFAYCQRMAIEKARQGWNNSDKLAPVLGADTVVVRDGVSLGKPVDRDSALHMLHSLSGRAHQVVSAVSVIHNDQQETASVKNTVYFETLPGDWIQAYVDSGEPMDKAGAYGIQGAAAMWISQISGSYSAIMGLPLFETAQILYKLGIIRDLTGD